MCSSNINVLKNLHKRLCISNQLLEVLCCWSGDHMLSIKGLMPCPTLGTHLTQKSSEARVGFPLQPQAPKGRRGWEGFQWEGF